MEKFPLNTPITKTNSSKSESVSSVVQLCPNLCNPMECSKPGLPVHHELPKLAQIHVHRVRDAIKPSHPLSSPSPPAFNLSQHQGLFNESVLCIRWPRVLEFQLQHQSFQWISGLISSRIDLFDLLEVQGTLKSILQVHSPSLLQDHSSKVSILCCSPFFIVQLSHPYISSVQFSHSVMSDSLQPHGLQHARLPWPSPTPGGYSNSKSIELVMPSNHLILCCPRLLPSSIFPSIRVFSSESALHIRWPKCWSFNFNISPSSEHPGLIFFRMDWLDLLAVQGTLKSLLQHHSSKASILQHSSFFTFQLSHPYMTTGKTIALTRRTFVGKVMSLLFNMLSRLVVPFLPRSKCLLISWLNLKILYC